ncbi:MAG: diguanylate cyclase [Planctomycetaceae bacterium]|nr:diguanylate cyclase [Planctomycetaceae bacterium]
MSDTVARPLLLQGSGLFGPAELRRLLQAEFVRARRHGFPLSCLVVGVDRLGALHDLYGRESKLEIQRSVGAVLHSDRRMSDLLVPLTDDRLVILVPHASLEGVRTLVRRLQRRARRLRFEGESRALEITLSVGLVQGRGDELVDVEAFLDAAAKAQATASQLGGDRAVEGRPHVPKPARPSGPRGDETLADLADRLAASGAGASLISALFELLGDRERAQGRAAPSGAPPGAAPAAPQTPVRPPLPQAAPQAVPAAATDRRDDALELLERRMGKMAELLERVESSIAALQGQRSDPGVAAPAVAARIETLGALREELMGRIFEANVALRREVDQRHGPGQADQTAP